MIAPSIATRLVSVGPAEQWGSSGRNGYLLNPAGRSLGQEHDGLVGAEGQLVDCALIVGSRSGQSPFGSNTTTPHWLRTAM